MIFCQEIDCKSDSKEEEINTENRIAIEIESRKVIAVFDVLIKDSRMARVWIIANDKNDKIINKKRQ